MEGERPLYWDGLLDTYFEVFTVLNAGHAHTSSHCGVWLREDEDLVGLVLERNATAGNGQTIHAMDDQDQSQPFLRHTDVSPCSS